MSQILPLLEEMRGRLGMYLGSTSITRLAAFLRGYDYALEKVGAGKGDRFLSEFRDWVHRRFQSTKHSWEETILLHSTDEADAVQRFWALLDEYLAERKGVIPPTATGDYGPLDANGSPSIPPTSQAKL